MSGSGRVWRCIGGGTRLKIVEALAMRRAMVTTSLRCEGLEVEYGRHLLVADDPAAFADRVVELLRDHARRMALGAQGHQLVEECYNWRTIGGRLERALRDLTEQSAKCLVAEGGGMPPPSRG